MVKILRNNDKKSASISIQFLTSFRRSKLETEAHTDVLVYGSKNVLEDEISAA